MYCVTINFFSTSYQMYKFALKKAQNITTFIKYNQSKNNLEVQP